MTGASGSKDYVVELQSLRGLAALAVLLHHCLFYYSYDEALRLLAERAINAHGAVVLFFVLSGFVLTGAIKRAPDFGQFFVRRALRIFPALWLACLLGLLYVLVFHGWPVPVFVSTWFSPAYREESLELSRIAPAFLGAGYALPLPLWTIFVELAGSLLMPAMVLVARRSALLFAALATALAAWSFWGGMETPMHAGGYLVYFALGCATALWVVAWFKSVSNGGAVALALAALLVLLFGRQLGAWSYAVHYHHPAAALLEGLAASVLIGAIAARPALFPVLRARALCWLGDISYSLYLLHLPLMAFVAALGSEVLLLPGFTAADGTVRTLALVAATLPLSLVLAALSHRYVERPGLALARRLPTFARTGTA